MEVDDEKKSELLQDNEVEDEVTPMDVDVTDPPTEDQATVEDKIIDESMVEQP